MSDIPAAAPPAPEPPRPTVFAIPTPPQRGWSCLGAAFGLSLLFNLAAGIALIVVCRLPVLPRRRVRDAAGTLSLGYREGQAQQGRHHPRRRRHHGGLPRLRPQADRCGGPRQERKAVVLRVNSPGGTITASDDLYHRLVRLREGTAPHASGKKTLVVSMGSLAASGGYYISMPAEYLFAEETTLTGSIGVYAAFPNVAELGERAVSKWTLSNGARSRMAARPSRK